MIAIIIGAVLFWGGILIQFSTKNMALLRAGMYAALVGLFVAIGGMLYCAFTSAQPEPNTRSYTYPASEYELNLRIVEFEGQRDTTYVLVEKLDCLSTNYKAN